jgi:DNA repair exonuclease SbcCD ATPase subunit
MASTLEMLIRAKYVSSGAKTLESDLKSIQKAVSDLRASTLTVDINKFLPEPGSIAGVERELAAVTERLGQMREAQLAAFGQGESGRGAGVAIEETIQQLEKYQKILQGVVNTSKQVDFSASDYTIDTSTLEANITRVKGELETLRQAMSKAMVIDDKDAGEAFKKQIKQLEVYRKTWEDTLKSMRVKQGVSPADMILSEQDTANIKARATRVRLEMDGLRNAIAKLTTSGQDTTGAKTRLRELTTELGTLRAAVKDWDGVDLDPSKHIFREEDVGAVKRRIKALEEDILEYKKAAASLAATGNDEMAQSFTNAAKGIEKKKRALEETLPVIKKTGDGIDELLTNRLTRLGFGIFALTQSFRTIGGVISGFFDALLEGSSSLDRSRSFQILTTGQGIDPGQMSARLKSASQGLVTMDQAMSRTIQLAKAGFPEIAKNSDALLRVATNAAIVSGDLASVSTVYDKLIRGIIRGSPLLIDDADIVLKLGDANEKYAASIGKTVEQLSAAEKVQSTYNAVMQEGERINALAEQMDSTSVKVAKMKTEYLEIKEALLEVLAIFVDTTGALDGPNEGIASLYTSLKSISDLPVGEKFAFWASSMSSLKGILVQFSIGLSGLFTIFIHVVTEAGARIGDFAKLTKLAFDQVYLAALAAAQGMGLVAGSADETIAKLTAAVSLYKDEFARSVDEISTYGDRLAEKLKKIRDESLEAANFIAGPGRTGVDITGVDSAPEEAATAQTTENLEKLLRERARMSEDIEWERVRKIQDINRNHVDKMRDISRKLADMLTKIAQDLNQKLADLQQKHIDKLSDIAQTLSDKMADIDQDLADKLSDVQESAAEKRREAEEDYRQGLLDAEEDYQKKLRDIQRKYEASRLKSLIDRDARGLFEAEQQRKEDLESAKETAEEKRKDELEKLQKKLDDINKKEEQQRLDAIKNAENRRRDAIQAYERARRDAIQAYERARQDAIQDAERRRRDAREAAARERQEALIDQANARQDLQNWYRDKLRDLVRYHADELAHHSQHFSNVNALTSQFMQQQTDAWTGFLNRNREWHGIGSPTDPLTGQDWPDWRNPANVYEGGRCNRGSSQLTLGQDGKQYVCINLRWRLYTGVGVTGEASAAGGFAGGMSGGMAGASSFGGQRIKVVLEGNGDDALTQIIKSGAYEAFLEIIG